MPRPALAALALLLMLPAGCGLPVHGAPPIDALLAGRTVIYGPPGGTKATNAWQVWNADGTTTYQGHGMFGGRRDGEWWVQGGRYCERLGQATVATCWRVTPGSNGTSVKFWEIPDDLIDYALFHRELYGELQP